MEKQHCELQKYHYEALKNPLYAMTGLMEIMREELLMEMPRVPMEEIEQKIVLPEPTAQLDTNTQLFGQVQYIQSKLLEHLARSKKVKYDRYKQ